MGDQEVAPDPFGQSKAYFIPSRLEKFRASLPFLHTWSQELGSSKPVYCWLFVCFACSIPRVCLGSSFNEHLCVESILRSAKIVASSQLAWYSNDYSCATPEYHAHSLAPTLNGTPPRFGIRSHIHGECVGSPPKSGNLVTMIINRRRAAPDCRHHLSTDLDS